MGPAAEDNRGLLPLSIAGWFSPLPWLGYAGGLVVPEDCHLALAAARASPVALCGDVQNDSRRATIPGVQPTREA